MVDDIDRAGPAAIELLSVIGSRLASGSTAVVATTGVPLGLAPNLQLASLTENKLAEFLGGAPDGLEQTLWLASGGLPGPARALAVELAGLGRNSAAPRYTALRRFRRLECHRRARWLPVGARAPRWSHIVIGCEVSRDMSKPRPCLRHNHESYTDCAVRVGIRVGAGAA